MTFVRRMRVVSTSAAIALSLAVAGPVSATTWDAPQYLNNGYVGEIVTTGGWEAVAVYLLPTGEPYVAPAELRVRQRIEFMGAPLWLSADVLAVNAIYGPIESLPSAAAWGQSVDVVYISQAERALYLRSTDGGASFAGARRLSPKAHDVYEVAVARRGDLVVVAWYAWNLGQTFVRVSTDGGDNFAPQSQVNGFSPEVAVGKNVIYVAYRRGMTGLYMKRSLKSGASWTNETVLSATARSVGGEGWGEIAASDGTAYVAYTSLPSEDMDPTVLQRRTTDRGQTWGPATRIDSAAASVAIGYAPSITMAGSVAHAIWARCPKAGCALGNGNLHYSRRTSTGWSAAEFVASIDAPADVGKAEKVIVLYSVFQGESDWDWDMFQRTGTP